MGDRQGERWRPCRLQAALGQINFREKYKLPLYLSLCRIHGSVYSSLKVPARWSCSPWTQCLLAPLFPRAVLWVGWEAQEQRRVGISYSGLFQSGLSRLPCLPQPHFSIKAQHRLWIVFPSVTEGHLLNRATTLMLVLQQSQYTRGHTTKALCGLTQKFTIRVSRVLKYRNIYQFKKFSCLLWIQMYYRC